MSFTIQVNDSHKRFATIELERLLHVDSFAFHSWRNIGSELHYRLMEWPSNSDEELEFSRLFPIDALYIWATGGGGLDPEWIKITNDEFINDEVDIAGLVKDSEGQNFRASVPSVEKFNPTLSAVEQLAAYGLWLIKEHIDCRKEDYGWTRTQIASHRTECILLAYQALIYSQKIMLGMPPSIEEIEKAKKLFLSESGKAGSDKRHAPMRILKDWTLNQYQTGSWPSANKASHDLKEKVLAHGRTIGAHLSIENAQRTIAEWIRKSA